jgi:hypothetical protein
VTDVCCQILCLQFKNRDPEKTTITEVAKINVELTDCVSAIASLRIAPQKTQRKKAASLSSLLCTSPN